MHFLAYVPPLPTFSHLCGYSWASGIKCNVEPSWTPFSKCSMSHPRQLKRAYSAWHEMGDGGQIGDSGQIGDDHWHAGPLCHRHKDLTIIQVVRATIQFANTTYRAQAVWMQRNSKMTQPKPIITNRATINLSLFGFFARPDRLYHTIT